LNPRFGLKQTIIRAKKPLTGPISWAFEEAAALVGSVLLDAKLDHMGQLAIGA